LRWKKAACPAILGQTADFIGVIQFFALRFVGYDDKVSISSLPTLTQRFQGFLFLSNLLE